MLGYCLIECIEVNIDWIFRIVPYETITERFVRRRPEYVPPRASRAEAEKYTPVFACTTVEWRSEWQAERLEPFLLFVVDVAAERLTLIIREDQQDA